MSRTSTYKGVIREGKIVMLSESESTLPEGTQVEIRLVERESDLVEHKTVEEERWRRQSEESWATIAWGTI